ncbi:MAG: HEAT repeat domain-containing protein [Gammaproteobacteria bacterium]|nr:HEAT repeat domain-containing protein [Gammaproteobacteria bacterium]
MTLENMTLEKETREVLCQLLQTGDEADRCYAARTLGILGGRESVDTLIERLKDEDVDVSIDAAEALGNIGATEAVPALIESLENDPSGEVCTMIAEALGKIRSSESIDPLLKILLQRPDYLEWDDDWDTWWDVQKEAVKALGLLKAEKAVDALPGLIDDEQQQDIEPEILNTLIDISTAGEARVIERLQNQQSLPPQRRRAAHALAKSTTPEATRALGRALRDNAAQVRAEAALALAEKQAANYLGALLLLLKDPHEEVRRAAVTAVTRLAEDGANAGELQEALELMLSDPDSQVRATLLTLLLPAVSDSPLSEQNFQAVVECMSDTAAETAAAACTLLGANTDPAAIAPLLSLIDDANGHPMVRREAAISIGKLGRIDAHVMASLGKAVTDEQQTVRLAALTALMELENSGVLITDDLVDDEEHPLPRPLELVVDAVNGKIAIIEESPSPADETVKDEDETKEHIAESETGDSAQARESAPEVAVDTIDLPETPAQIVREGEVEVATSTLDAIAMENVESMMNASAPAAEEIIEDEVTREYRGIVKDNKAMMRRIRSHRKTDVQQDVRRLAARVLATTDDPLAIDTLIHALNDDDDLIRREAAEAIGVIARRSRQIPELMDAVGALITQLAISDIDHKVTCARTLSYLGNRAALGPLIEATKAPEYTLRVQAIDALVRLSLNSRNPDEAGHMVVRDVPPLSIARKLMESLDDDDMGARVAAARGLAQILSPLNEENFTRKAVKKVVSSVMLSTGEEARLLGRALRQFDTRLGNEELLVQLKAAEDSVKRSVFIEMIEELLQPEKAA